MSLEKAKAYLENKGFLDHVIELADSTATVAMAAEALGVEPGMIAKTMSFLQGEQAVLILTEGTAKVDNRKYKDTFHVKAKMIPSDAVEEVIGHAPGGVCPFGINDGVEVYLDESLKKFTIVYPAAGNDHSAVKLTIPELEQIAGAKGWVDVCKEENKGLFILVKTSNPSSGEFQDRIIDGRPLYEWVGEKVAQWGESHMGNEYSYVGAVVGATYPEMGKTLRKIMPKTFILVPGYGAQGGKGADLVHFFNEDGLGAIVNSSRGIIAAYKQEKYASFGELNYADASRQAVKDMIEDISTALNNR